MDPTTYFDRVISSDLDLPNPRVSNLPEMLFFPLPHREEQSMVILSHSGNNLVEISLQRLRFIVFQLIEEYRQKKFISGQTVMLANISGNHELFLALHFIALSSLGIRVLLPMFIESLELDEWLIKTGCTAILVPDQEIIALNHHEKEKAILRRIRQTAADHSIPCYDNEVEFNLKELINRDITDSDLPGKEWINKIFKLTPPESEAILISTSGTSGKSKLVAYAHGAYILNCLSWQKAGFYEPDKLGGRGFTPLFTHTMGIRAFINAIWTGTPVCLINTDWFTEKPEVVSYFMRKMKPQHVTGGPAIYTLLLELMRNFPEIKETLSREFKTLVSSGAPMNSETIREVESAFGLKLQNAYGTTETQQAMSTLLCNSPAEIKQNFLGKPLPGVRIGLKKMTGEPGRYRLFISSPFGMIMPQKKDEDSSGYPADFFDTGDVVRLSGDYILYDRRAKKDFFKDGFGVKIPSQNLNTYYAPLLSQVEYLAFYPVRSRPGQAALIFLTDQSIQKGAVTDRSVINKYKNLINGIHSHLFHQLEPFEIRHRLIIRFILINQKVPTTVKGNVSQYKIESQFEALIQHLSDPLTPEPAVVEVHQMVDLANTFTRQHNPFIGNMLTAARLDYSYHKGEKDTLYTHMDGQETAVIDLVGGYGLNLLGHNHPVIRDSIHDFVDSRKVPLADQGSIQEYASLLAEELDLMVGEVTGDSYYALFGSTGSEAVEVALHHALYEWWKKLKRIKEKQFQQFGKDDPGLLNEIWEQNETLLAQSNVAVLAFQDAYHGHSSAARSLMGNLHNRETFVNLLAIDAVFIDDQDDNWSKQIDDGVKQAQVTLQRATRRNGCITKEDFQYSVLIAAIAEPVIGEGGVRTVRQEVLKQLGSFDFPLILDEIQCGLGRTGTFLASEGIRADYYLFAKALGGGFEKISAILISKSRYQHDFGKYYSSTFANGGLAARLALDTLMVIKTDQIPSLARQKGEQLKNGLISIQTEFPDCIKAITGRGLMLGIRLRLFLKSDSIILRILAERELLGYVCAAYLLAHHHIRILPTVSQPNTLRLEPSAYITNDEVEKILTGIRDLSEKISRREIYILLKPLMEQDAFNDEKGKIHQNGFFHNSVDDPAPGAVQIALLAHFAYPTDELRMFDRDLCQASDTGLRILFNRMQVLMNMKPFVLFAKNLFGDRIHFKVFLLPLDVAELERLHRQNKKYQVVSRIQEAVNMAHQGGAQVISLGGYTSILTADGQLISAPEDSQVVTGNTLTAASGIRNLVRHMDEYLAPHQPRDLAIVGASGNIGSSIAEWMHRTGAKLDSVWLFGRNRSRLEKLKADLEGKTETRPAFRLHTSTDLKKLRKCNIIIAATNTNDPIIFKHHINQDSRVLITDLSIPGAISKEVKGLDNVIELPFAAFIALPEDPDFIVSSHTPKGTVFCCAAEAILCGLENIRLNLTGRISADNLEEIMKLAEKRDFFKYFVPARSFKGKYSK